MKFPVSSYMEGLSWASGEDSEIASGHDIVYRRCLNGIEQRERRKGAHRGEAVY